jgi:hypothetical protein
MKNMVVDKVCHMLTTMILTIILSMSKTFLSHYLFNEDGEGLWNFSKVEN